MTQPALFDALELEPSDAAVEAWVREVNRVGRKMDEWAEALHPSAWPEALGPQISRGRELARRGP